MSETATQRLGRLLDMVPWLLHHRGVAVLDAAHEFGVTEQQLVDDLELLFVCGTPGYGHAELIDAQWESGHIYLDNADDIAAPMRLSQDEAVTLIAGLQALGSSLLNPEVTQRTLTKLRAARAATATSGRGGDPATRIALELDDGTQHPAMAALKTALATRSRVHLSYYVPTRDETTERDVDLMRVVHFDGQWYAEGWCHRAVDVRLFRLDRIDAATVLDVDGTPPPQAQSRTLDDVFVAAPDDLTVVIEANADAAWIADYYPNEGVTRVATAADGASAGVPAIRITLKVADPALVRRLMLRLGGQARVVEPLELAVAVAQQARAALTAYS